MIINGTIVFVNSRTPKCFVVDLFQNANYEETNITFLLAILGFHQGFEGHWLYFFGTMGSNQPIEASVFVCWSRLGSL